jgi:DNA-binding transcriptional MerR regulator
MASDVRRLKDVLMMRRLGIGIASIRKIFETSPEFTNNQEIINLLRSHLETLRNRQAEVSKQLEDTSAMLRHYSNEFDRSVETDTTS